LGSDFSNILWFTIVKLQTKNTLRNFIISKLLFSQNLAVTFMPPLTATTFKTYSVLSPATCLAIVFT